MKKKTTPLNYSVKISASTFKQISDLSKIEFRTKKLIIQRAIDLYSYNVVPKEKQRKELKLKARLRPWRAA